MAEGRQIGTTRKCVSAGTTRGGKLADTIILPESVTESITFIRANQRSEAAKDAPRCFPPAVGIT